MDNIAIIVKSLKGGGAERAAANLSKDLSSKYNVYLILFDATDIAYPYEGNIIDLSTLPAKNVFFKVVNFLKRLIKIIQIKRKISFKATVSFMPSANLLNVLSRKNDKVIVSIRNMMSRRSRSRLQNFLITAVGKFSDITVSLSEGVRQDLINNFSYSPKKVVTVYNSCDSSWFVKKNGVRIPDLKIDNKTLFMTGRLTEQKGQWHALRALSLVKKQIPDCQLVIFGDGELRDELQAYAVKLGVADNVKFMGYVKDYHSLLTEGRAFIFPSLYEGLGNVILEALACGLPVISANCPYGPAEILAPYENVTDMVHYGEYGILVAPFSDTVFDASNTKFEASDEALSKAIIEIVTNDCLHRYYREKSLLRINDFSPDLIRRQWIDIIEGEHN